MDLPAGTVTFLFTDIEGSTKLLQKLGDRYADALATHRDLLRAIFEKFNGREVDTQGDSFFVAFPRASDAISASAEIQQALEDQDWPGGTKLRVRMGLHTGEPELADEGYVGVDVHRAARIAAVGHGGQILLSSSTYAIVGNDLPDGTSTRDLGEHRLKDLSHPEHLYQLRVKGLPDDFPPLRTLDPEITNLPLQPTSFVGRQEEIREIGAIMSDPDCHLLTLVGPGGIGKTRLALQSAAEMVPSYADGTYFVPLAPLNSGDQLIPTVARVMKFAVDVHSSDLDPKSQILDYLSDRAVLMVMDNFEHVLDGAEVVAEFIETAPKVKILVTSREKLNLRGEWTFDVEGMRFPTNGNGAGVAKYSALQLFLERARQVDPHFVFTEEVKADVYRICRLVGGMPLGIELATAWLSMLSPKEIADEIESSLDFLSSTQRDLPEKHRSLRAAFDYSWRLLSEDERKSFQALSVFRGGFEREAAKSVAEADIRMLSGFVDKSLLQRNDPGRYEVHELLRQYAEEKLNESSQQAEKIHEAHAIYYVDYLAARESGMMGEGLIEIRDEVRAEIDNLRRAVDWALVQWESERVRKMLRSLNSFYHVQGWHEGVDVFQTLVERVKTERSRETSLEDDPVYLSVKTIGTSFFSQLGMHEAAEKVFQELLPKVREYGMAWEEAGILASLCITRSLSGDYVESIEFAEEALPMAKEEGDDILITVILLWQGWDHYLLGQYDKALSLFEESYRMNKSGGNPWTLSFTLSKLGLIADAMKDYQKALDYHDEARQSFISLQDQAGEAYTLSRKSMSYYGLGNFEEAIQVGKRAFELFDELGHRWGIGISLCRYAYPTLASGRVEEAKDLFTQGLRRAQEYKMEGMALFAIGGLASVLSVEGDYARANDVFTFFLNHPMTAAIYKDMVAKFVEDTRAVLTQDEIESSDTWAEIQDIERVTAMLLETPETVRVSGQTPAIS